MTTVTTAYSCNKLRVEQELIDFVTRYRKENQRWPSVAEIQIELNSNSPGTIMATLIRLQNNKVLPSDYRFRHEDMTQAQREVFSFILRFKVLNDGMTPTMREIAAGLGYKSSSTAHRTVLQLRDIGFLKMDATKNRAIRIPGGQYHYNPSRTGVTI